MANHKRKERRLIQPSTIAMFNEARRTEGYSLKDWLHGYFYGRWPYLYIGVGIGEHPAARRWGPALARLSRWWGRLLGRDQAAPTERAKQGMANTYHGKVVPIEAAKQLVLVNEPVRLLGLEQIIPYPKAHDIILKNPDHIIVMDCPCRAARAEPCLPMDVCLVVGEPFASFVAEHHPDKTRWISQQDAVEILQAEEARGHVHHAFFKDAMLNRFYAICNCCSCCCGAMQSQRNGTPMLASSGFVCQVDAGLCIGCETCVPVCQFEALSLDADFLMAVDAVTCMGCGVCVSHCDQEALTLVRAPEKGEPLEIFALMEQAAQSADRR